LLTTTEGCAATEVPENHDKMHKPLGHRSTEKEHVFCLLPRNVFHVFTGRQMSLTVDKRRKLFARTKCIKKFLLQCLLKHSYFFAQPTYLYPLSQNSSTISAFIVWFSHTVMWCCTSCSCHTADRLRLLLAVRMTSTQLLWRYVLVNHSSCRTA